MTKVYYFIELSTDNFDWSSADFIADKTASL